MSQEKPTAIIMDMSGTLYDPVFPDPFDEGVINSRYNSPYNQVHNVHWEVIVLGVSGDVKEDSYLSTSFHSYDAARKTRDTALRHGYCAIMRKIK